MGERSEDVFFKSSEPACAGGDIVDRLSISSNSSFGGESSTNVLSHFVTFDEIVEAASCDSKSDFDSRSLERMEHVLSFSRLASSSTVHDKTAPTRTAAIAPCDTVFPVEYDDDDDDEAEGCDDPSFDGDSVFPPDSSHESWSSSNLREHHSSSSEKRLRRFRSFRFSKKRAWDENSNSSSLASDSAESSEDGMKECPRTKHDLILAWEFSPTEKKPCVKPLPLSDISDLHSTSTYLFAAILFVLDKQKKKVKQTKKSAEKKNSRENSKEIPMSDKDETKKVKKSASKDDMGSTTEGLTSSRREEATGSKHDSSSAKKRKIPRRASIGEMEHFTPQTCVSWSDEIETRGRLESFASLPRVSDSEIRRLAQSENYSKKLSFPANKQQRETLEHLFAKPAVRTGDSALFPGKKKRPLSASSTCASNIASVSSGSTAQQIGKIMMTEVPQTKHGICDVDIELFLWRGASCAKEVYMAAFAKAQLLDSALSMPSAANAAVAWIYEKKRVHCRAMKVDSDLIKINPDSLPAAIRHSLLDIVRNKPGTSLSLKTAVLTVARDKPVKPRKRRAPSESNVGNKHDAPKMWSNAMAPAKPEANSKHKHHRHKEKKAGSTKTVTPESAQESSTDRASEPSNQMPVRFHLPAAQSGSKQVLVRNLTMTNLASASVSSPDKAEFSPHERTRCSPGAQEAADTNHRQIASDRGKVSPLNRSLTLSELSPSSSSSLEETPRKATRSPKKIPPRLMLTKRSEDNCGSLLGSETLSTSRRPASVGKLSLDKVKSGDPKRVEVKPRMSLNLSITGLRIEEEPDEEPDGEGAPRYYRRVVSEIEDGLYLTGDEGASNYAELKRCNIVYIINAADRVCQEHFPGKFRYLSLDLLDDGGKEDLRPLFLLVIDIIESNRAKGGSTLLHCQQGISRSATLTVAYVMWKRHMAFRSALDWVTSKRPVVSPNGGFMGQLLLWESLLRSVWNSARCPHLLRMSALESSRHEVLIVGKELGVLSRASLDSRGCYVYHDPSTSTAYSWLGERSTEEYRNAAMTFVDQLQHYLGVQSAPQVFQGFEPAKFWAALGETPGIVTTVGAFDREYSCLEPNVIYRFTAWDRIDVYNSRLLEESKCQAWAYYLKPLHADPPDGTSKASSESDVSSPSTPDGTTKGEEQVDKQTVRANGQAFFWIPENFVVRLENEYETRDPEEVFAIISSVFIRAGGFPPDTLCRKVSHPGAILDLKFPTLQPQAKPTKEQKAKEKKSSKGTMKSKKAEKGEKME